jgi:sRNA-binding carbon storage regulator CsrA
MVVAVQGEAVRIGISARKEVVVERREVAEKRKHWLSEEPSFSPPPTNDEITGLLRPLPA